MGLWLLQECRRAWSIDYDELQRLAEEVRGEVPLFDPDDDAFLAPDDMPSQIASACRELGQPAPQTRGETVRSILVSLACKYRLVLERVERVSGERVEVLHVIGGGVHNRLLCELTADLLGRTVLAGPDEATALGNVLVQARAAGELGSLTEMREVVAASIEPEEFAPSDRRDDADATYERFLEVTGLAGAP